MPDGDDGFDRDGGGGSFMIGLLAGTVLGAGLGILFAPRPGAELRSQIAEEAGNLIDALAQAPSSSAANAGRRAVEEAEPNVSNQENSSEAESERSS